MVYWVILVLLIIEGCKISLANSSPFAVKKYKMEKLDCPNRHTMLFSNWIKCGIDDNVKIMLD